MIKIYQDSPYFVDGIELSGSDLNLMRQNAIVLDAVSLLGPKATSGVVVWNGSPAFIAWKGSFEYLTGVDTATFGFYANANDKTALKIYFKKESDAEDSLGTLVFTDATPVGTITASIDMSGFGYTNKEIIQVTVVVEGPDNDCDGLFYLTDAYLSPISSYTGLAAWGGLDTFGDTDATSLNKLANAQDWLANRLALIPEICQMYPRYAYSTYKPETKELWTGYIMRSNGCNVLQIDFNYYCSNISERFHLYVNGTDVVDSAVLTNGPTGNTRLYWDASGLTENVNYFVQFKLIVTTGCQLSNGENRIHTRYSINYVRMVPGGFAYSYATPALDFDIMESMNYTTLKSRVDTIRSMTQTVYTRITTNTALFNRIPMFRQRWGDDDHEVTKWTKIAVPVGRRRGKYLKVRGRDIKIQYGAVELKPDFKTSGMESDFYSHIKEETLIENDKIQTKVINLDQYKELYNGRVYYIAGKDIIYAAEYLR